MQKELHVLWHLLLLVMPLKLRPSKLGQVLISKLSSRSSTTWKEICILCKRLYFPLYIYISLTPSDFIWLYLLSPIFGIRWWAPIEKKALFVSAKENIFALQKIYHFISDFFSCIPLCQNFGATDRQSQIVWSRKVTTWSPQQFILNHPVFIIVPTTFYICPNSILKGNRMVRYGDPWFQRCYQISWNRCPLVGFLFIRFL